MYPETRCFPPIRYFINKIPTIYLKKNLTNYIFAILHDALWYQGAFKKKSNECDFNGYFQNGSRDFQSPVSVFTELHIMNMCSFGTN